MNLLLRFLSISLVCALVLGPVAQAGQLPPALSSGAQRYQTEFKRFRSALDSGAVTPEAALRDFGLALRDRQVEPRDAVEFLKSKLSPREFEALNASMQTALSGIDMDSLQPEEQAELFLQALSSARVEGLSWSSCQTSHLLRGLGGLGVAALLFLVVHKVNQRVARVWNDYNAEKAATEEGFASRILASQSPEEVNLLVAERDATLERMLNDAKARGDDNGASDLDILGVVGVLYALGNLITIRAECNGR